MIPLLPETAPFNPDQRAWLNGFFAGLLGLQQANDLSLTPTAPAEEEDVDYPWHDPALALNERMTMAGNAAIFANRMQMHSRMVMRRI